MLLLQENPKVRTDLLRAVFRACDTNGDDWLGESEFRHIAGALLNLSVVPAQVSVSRCFTAPLRIWTYPSDTVMLHSWRCAQARFYGFSGSDEKWSEEFKKLCEEKNVDHKKGIGRLQNRFA